MFSTYIPPKYLAKHGENITEQKLGNIQFGETQSKVTNNRDFVDKSRIEELKNINSNNYDLKRLIKLCEEINDNFNNENYLSVGMIGRTIINHIPPIFGLKNFNEVSNNYSNGSQSFKKSMNSLNNSLKNIADGFLHQTIRKTETLPNTTQVNFSQDLDVLLEEIVRILN